MTDPVRKGTRLRVVAAHEVSLMTHWSAPFTDAFKVIPEVGTVLVADADPVPGAKAFYCRPEDYPRFEAAHVPPDTRANRRYAGYSLVVDAAEIGVSLERLD